MLFIKCRHLYSENIHFAFISSNAAYDIFQVNSGRQSNVECLLVYSFTHLIQIFFRAFRGQESRYLIEYWALPWHLLYHTWHLMQGKKKDLCQHIIQLLFFFCLDPWPRPFTLDFCWQGRQYLNTVCQVWSNYILVSGVQSKVHHMTWSEVKLLVKSKRKSFKPNLFTNGNV